MEAFRQEGDYWAVSYAGTTVRIANTKGMGYLARLLADPGREFHALDLVTAQATGVPAGAVDPDAGLATTRNGTTGPMLDAAAKAAYRRRMAELREELEEAERFGDPERAARAHTALQTLADHVTAAVGLGGRDRRAADTAERARVSVTKAVRAAIRRIVNHHPALGSHLQRSVRTGIYCCYEPDPYNLPSWEAGSAVAPAASRRPGPPVSTSATTLVGREVELAHLSTLLKTALSGRGALVVLVGDAGIGKTRLAAEILSQAADQRARTALGRCPEAEDSLALLPFGQILETLATSMSDAELGVAAGYEASQLVKMLPVLRRRLPKTPEAHPLPPAAERQALLDGIITFLDRAAGDQGLVLLFDDLQWADETTLACLERLADRPRCMRWCPTASGWSSGTD
ncbi:MAG: AAA family ATPase [Pseudonocardiaceae bacterium]